MPPRARQCNDGPSLRDRSRSEGGHSSAWNAVGDAEPAPLFICHHLKIKRRRLCESQAAHARSHSTRTVKRTKVHTSPSSSDYNRNVFMMHRTEVPATQACITNTSPPLAHHQGAGARRGPSPLCTALAHTLQPTHTHSRPRTGTVPLPPKTRVEVAPPAPPPAPPPLSTTALDHPPTRHPLFSAATPTPTPTAPLQERLHALPLGLLLAAAGRRRRRRRQVRIHIAAHL